MSYNIKLFKKLSKSGVKYYKLKINDIYLDINNDIQRCANLLHVYYEVEALGQQCYVEWEDDYVILSFDIDVLEKDAVINKIIDLIPEEFL